MPPFSAFWSKLESRPVSLKRIGFTDSNDPRVLESIRFLQDRNLVDPVLIGPVPPEDRSRFAALLAEKQKKSNLSASDLQSQMEDSLYHGVCLLLEKRIDGLVSGSLRPTADIVRAAIQCVGPKAGVRLVSGHFLIETETLSTNNRTPFLFADCAVMPEPSPRALASTAIAAAEAYRFFTGETPKVAFLSFSTRGSAMHPLVDRIKEALDITRKLDANLTVDGELQADAALDREVAVIKNAGESMVAGQANVFVFPTLEAGNIGYKLIQRFSKARIAGPLLWGLDRPMSDLSRGCTVREISDTALSVAMMAGRGN